MNGHLSSEEISDWLIGERTRDTEGHLRACGYCAGKVREVAEPLELFRGAVRNWAVEPATIRSAPSRAGWRWGLAVAALMVAIAAPVYRKEATKRQEVADDLLLQEVQKGISRSVPAPMEPLAKLMVSK